MKSKKSIRRTGFAIAALSALGHISPVLASDSPSEPRPAWSSLPSLQSVSFPSEGGSGCELRAFHLAQFDMGHEDGAENYSTLMNAIVETNTVPCLENYGIVQFIRGCVYESSVEPGTGQVTRRFSYGRDLRGGNSRFIHRDWTVDSTDEDPIYTGRFRPGVKNLRFGEYAFPLRKLNLRNDPKALSADYQILRSYLFPDSKSRPLIGYYSQKKPEFPIVFASDNPGPSALYSPKYGYAKNVSLEFKTCVYDINNIPVTGDPRPPGTPRSEGGPIQCFDWKFIEIYDHGKNAFVSRDEIDPFCYSER